MACSPTKRQGMLRQSFAAKSHAASTLHTRVGKAATQLPGVPVLPVLLKLRLHLANLFEGRCRISFMYTGSAGFSLTHCTGAQIAKPHFRKIQRAMLKTMPGMCRCCSPQCGAAGLSGPEQLRGGQWQPRRPRLRLAACKALRARHPVGSLGRPRHGCRQRWIGKHALGSGAWGCWHLRRALPPWAERWPAGLAAASPGDPSLQHRLTGSGSCSNAAWSCPRQSADMFS